MKIDARSKIISVFLLSSACFASDRVLPFVFLCSLTGIICSKGIRIKIFKFAIPVIIFSFSVFILKAVSFQNGLIISINSSWILPAKILVSSFLGFLMILSTDMLSLSKAVFVILSPVPFVNRIGVNTIISLSAANVKMFSVIWNQKYNAVRSRSAVLSFKLLSSFSISMITSAFRHSEDIALALESRNYTGEIKSGFTSMKLIDYAVIICSIGVFLYALSDRYITY
ncbi:MAG: hypothetical protein KAZ87_07465 [Spirochaetes bacterium]|nr:hypothetical protein [Spirochaetota bacterium]